MLKFNLGGHSVMMRRAKEVIQYLSALKSNRIDHGNLVTIKLVKMMG